MVGGKKVDDISGTNLAQSKQLAVIGRTNMAVFDALDDNLNTLHNNKKGGTFHKAVALAGGVANYNFDVYLDIFYLKFYKSPPLVPQSS